MAFHMKSINYDKDENEKNAVVEKSEKMSDISVSPVRSHEKREEPPSKNARNPNCTEGTGIFVDVKDKIVKSVTNTKMCDSRRQTPNLPDYIPSYISRPSSDDDSVSTLGSIEEAAERGSSGRSIFRDYWKADEKGSQKAPIRKQSVATLATGETIISSYADSIRLSRDWTAYINEEVFDHNNHGTASSNHRRLDSNGYESYLKVNEAGRTILPSAALLKDTKNSEHEEMTPSNPLVSTSPNSPHQHNARRRIFPRVNWQLKASINSYGYMYTKPTKGKAPLPFLLHNKKMLRSSLRDRSASLSESTTLDDSYLSSHSRPSVSFERQVTIHEYEKPVQQYVHDGWSERFAI
jgi:hypothetical protein